MPLTLMLNVGKTILAFKSSFFNMEVAFPFTLTRPVGNHKANSPKGKPS